MPWSIQSGGSWGGGGGPWGSRPGGPGGPRPPNLEDLLSKGQDRMRRILPGGLGTGRGLAIGALVVVVLWLMTGFYRVDAGEHRMIRSRGADQGRRALRPRPGGEHEGGTVVPGLDAHHDRDVRRLR